MEGESGRGFYPGGLLVSTGSVFFLSSRLWLFQSFCLGIHFSPYFTLYYVSLEIACHLHCTTLRESMSEIYFSLIWSRIYFLLWCWNIIYLTTQLTPGWRKSGFPLRKTFLILNTGDSPNTSNRLMIELKNPVYR